MKFILFFSLLMLGILGLLLLSSPGDAFADLLDGPRNVLRSSANMFQSSTDAFQDLAGGLKFP